MTFNRQTRKKKIDIRTWEEISLNIWPTLRSFLWDGWIVRESDGYTKRSNSVNPLYPGTADLRGKIIRCEDFFFSRNCDSVFKMTDSALPPELDAVLEKRGYRKDSPTSVQTIDLDLCPAETSCSIAIEQVFL